MRRGLAASRQQAQDLVARGAVRVGGATADKPARLVAAGDPILVDDGARRFVSRGGDKLDAALARFGVSVAGVRCLDAGASTGGFTDCLLQHGAAHVCAVDVGYGQFDPRLRADPRVTLCERTNVRDLHGDGLGGPFALLVADLSFVSLTAVVPRLAGDLAAPGAVLLLLVKPQFEAGRVEVSRGRGVIRDPVVRRRALDAVASALVAAGASIMGAMASPVLGPAGNAEFFVCARAHTSTPPAGVVGGRPGAETPPAAGQRAEYAALLDAAVAEAPDAAVAEAPDAAVVGTPDAAVPPGAAES